MSYLGYYIKGEEIFIPVVSTTSIATPIAPDNAPIILLFNSSGVLEKQYTVPRVGEVKDFWHFGSEYFIGSSLAAGKYTAIAAYDKNPSFYIHAMYFDVYDSGDLHGSPVSMASVKFENARFVVSQLNSGSIIRGRLDAQY